MPILPISTYALHIVQFFYLIIFTFLLTETERLLNVKVTERFHITVRGVPVIASSIVRAGEWLSAAGLQQLSRLFCCHSIPSKAHLPLRESLEKRSTDLVHLCFLWCCRELGSRGRERWRGGGSVTQEFTLTVLYLFGLLIFYRKDNMFAWAGFINIPPSTHLLY